MHENRETSVVPEAVTGRSGKAYGRMDMYAAEESDFGVVPMNQPNRGGKPQAEVGEGRPEIKENIAQSNTRPTQSVGNVSQGLSGVRRRAKERKQEKFTALLHHLTVDRLRKTTSLCSGERHPGSMARRGSSMGRGWRGGLPTCTVAYIGAPIGRSRREGSIYRRPTGGSVRWASRHWRTRSFNRLW